MNDTVNERSREENGRGDQPTLLFDMPELHAGRCWTVDSAAGQFEEALAMRIVLTPEKLETEVRWFKQFEYGRAVLQFHVEQVLGQKLKTRKEIYKRWRQDLGDDQARTYAKFSEYCIEHGRPKWFVEQLTQYPDTIVLPPSCALTILPVSWNTSSPTPDVTRNRWR